MRTAFFLWAILAFGALGAGCGGSKTDENAVEGAGLTKEKAVVIHAKNEKDGYQEELNWLVKHYPDYQFTKQTLMKERDMVVYKYDEITVGGGKAVTLYFDITSCYGMSSTGKAHFY